jgi:hypothetical protein
MKNLIKLLLILLPEVVLAQQSDSNIIEELNLDSIFSPKTGTFVLYSLNTYTYSVYNLTGMKPAIGYYSYNQRYNPPHNQDIFRVSSKIIDKLKEKYVEK